jgi:hypothetical protein
MLRYDNRLANDSLSNGGNTLAVRGRARSPGSITIVLVRLPSDTLLLLDEDGEDDDEAIRRRRTDGGKRRNQLL